MSRPPIFNFRSIHVVARDPTGAYERVYGISFSNDEKSDLIPERIRRRYQHTMLFVKTDPLLATGYDVYVDGRIYKRIMKDGQIYCDFLADAWLEFLPDFEYVRLAPETDADIVRIHVSDPAILRDLVDGITAIEPKP